MPFRSLTCVLILLFSQSLWAHQTDTSLLRFVYPGAKALVGIQWSKVQTSEVGRWIQKRWISAEIVPGLEFLKDVDEVLISSPGVQAGAVDDEPPMLIAIRGDFDVARIQRILIQHGHHRQMFGNVPLYRRSGSEAGEPAFALLGANTILVADAQTLFSTIERSRVSAVENSPEPLIAKAQVLSSQYDCWAVMSEPGAMRNFLFASLAARAISPDSQGFQAGISIRDGLAIDMVLSVRTERAARTLVGSLTRSLRVEGGSPEFAELLQKLKVSTDHTNVFVSLRMNPAETAKALRARPDTKMAAAVPPPGPPAPKLFVRIQGLDDGPKDVPYTKQ